MLTLADMKKEGINPDERVYLALVNSYAKGARVDPRLMLVIFTDVLPVRTL